MRPTPKVEKQRGVAYARGGKGASRKMLPEVPAERAPAGRTGPSQVKGPGSQRARGGSRTSGFSLALPAVGGHTAPIRKGR